jgi:Protein of unknown function (DUF2795)
MPEPSPIDLQRDLKGIKYPASRDELVKIAERNKADKDITERLRSLPEKRFEGPDDVSREMFGK